MPVRCPTLTMIRRAVGSAPRNGTIRLLFVRASGRVGLVQTPHELANDADQFLALYLQRMISDVAAPGVVVAVHRDNGRPTYADRQLWEMLGARLAATSTVLLDLVVVGADQAWSMDQARPLSSRAATPRNAERRSTSRARAR